MFRKHTTKPILQSITTESIKSASNLKTASDTKLSESNTEIDIAKVPKFLTCLYCPHILKGSYVLAVTFMALTALNIYLAWVLLNMGYTRSAQIYMGFQIILLMPFIPLITGTIFLSRFLVVPFMSGLVITTLLHLLWLVFVIFGYNESLNEDFYINNITTRTIVISLWSVCVAFNASSFFMILVLWYTIGARLSLPKDNETHVAYPLRRFGIVFISFFVIIFVGAVERMFLYILDLCRDDDSVVYAYKSGSTEIFYHEAASGSVAGLPPPADLMGTASSKARRRLERDQAVLLL